MRATQDFFKADELANCGYQVPKTGILLDDPKFNSSLSNILKTPTHRLYLNCLTRHIGDDSLNNEQKYQIFKNLIKVYLAKGFTLPEKRQFEQIAGKDNLSKLENRGTKMQALVKGIRTLLKAVGLESLAHKLSAQRRIFHQTITNHTQNSAKR